jgi:hypothetical protein
MHAYSVDEQARLLQEGIDLLTAAGVPREDLRAFRAGNFGANNDTWRAMARCGLTVSSNLNPSFLGRNCRLSWPRAELSLFDTGCGVWELPVSNFIESGGAYRHLQIMAVSLSELKDYLKQARQLGLAEITLFTHSFEFFYIDDLKANKARLSWINLLRLRGLCRFLRAHADEFEVETVGALARRLPVPSVAAAAPAAFGSALMPRGSRLRRYGRLVEQLFKRVESGFKVESHYSS